MRIKLFLLTCGGLGRMPFAPGTWGSLGATIFAAIMLDIGLSSGHPNLMLVGLSVMIAALFFLGVRISDEYVAQTGDKDPSIIVVDEWVGQILAIIIFVGGMGLTSGVSGSFCKAAFVNYHGVEKWLLGGLILGGLFLLFRFYDIAKPWHAGKVDREIPGGMGVMLDDVYAGAYAGFTALILGWVIAAFI